MLSVNPCNSFVHCVWLVGTESTLGGTGIHKGPDPAGAKVDMTAGSSSAQKIEKPQEVISFEAAKEVFSYGCLIALAIETSSICFVLEVDPVLRQSYQICTSNPSSDACTSCRSSETHEAILANLQNMCYPLGTV